MQKIIPFKKEILFKNTIEEITSISMDHHLHREDYAVKGDFTVEGEYKSNSGTDTFHFEIPYLGYLEDHFDVSNILLDVDDFYYEITEPNKLSIHIDILVDKLSEKPLLEEEPIREEVIKEETTREEVKVEEPKKEEIREPLVEPAVATVFSNDVVQEEAYMTYKVYIVREGDTIPSILEKYGITEEILHQYNILNELNVGDKLIIPNEQN